MTWTRIARDSLVLLGIIGSVVYWVYLTQTGGAPVDAHAYWVADPNNLYAHDQLATDGYYYSPAFEFVVAWGRALPFEVFVAIWRAILFVILIYLAGPFTIFAMLTVPVASEINAGNIQLMLALAIVLGFRWQATWAFVVLTKLTPGVGALWFALRREWRAFGIAVGATLAIAAVSFVLNPSAWFDYIRLLTVSPAPATSPLYLTFWQRLPVALAFIVFGAWRGYRWPVVVGAMIALPVYYVISSSMLVGVLPFLRAELGRRWAERGGRTADLAGEEPKRPTTTPTPVSG